MNNQDAFEGEASSQLTVEGVVAQIAETKRSPNSAATKREASRNRLSSFGLTSISVAELGTFIQTQFNYQVSALELMTTASSLSLAQAIVHGTADVEQDQAETDRVDTEDASHTVQRHVRRAPSAFANAPEDHFPRRPPLGNRDCASLGRPARRMSGRGDPRHA